jgi:flagellar M-ring protein FliF
VNDQFKSILEKLKTLSLVQKVTLGTLLLGMGMAGFFLFNRANDQYDVLYSNLSLPDAAATVNKLKEVKVPYRLADGGTTVLVPKDQKSEMMLETADELTSSQGVSLAKIPPVLQGDVQKEWLKKFNSDEISTTLQSIQGIRDAKVMISTPEESVFTEKEDPIRASVMLVVEPGFRLEQKQVTTIKNLVSHAVPGLTPEQVVISDNYGNSLDDSPTANGTMQTRETRKSQMENALQKKLTDLIEPIVGEGNAVLSVSMDLNFDQARANIKTIKPEVIKDDKATGVIVSQQSESEEYEGAKKDEQGTPGSESNTAPSYKSKEDKDKSDKRYTNKKETTNYAHSEETKEVVYASGEVQRITIAVAMNKVLTEAESTEIKEMLANAAGLNLERGDSVDVKGFKFSESPNKKNELMTQAFKDAQRNDLLLQLGYIATLLTLGIMALMILKNAFEKNMPVSTAQLILDDEGQAIPEVVYSAKGEEIRVEDLAVDEKTGKVLLPEGPIYNAEGKMISLNGITKEELNLPKSKYTNAPEIEYMRQNIYGFIQKDTPLAAKILVAYMGHDQE